MTAQSEPEQYEPVTRSQAGVNRVILFSEVLAYELDHPEEQDPWTPEVLARYGPDTETPF